MRMSTGEGRDEELADATVAAAAAAGVTVFDTARAYGCGESDLSHNERLLARTLRACGAERGARVVTKGGMTRAGGAWVPDGRGKTLFGDCEASLTALDGLEIDVYLIHAPDPRTPWRTSVRALARLADEGLVRHVGLSNVNRRQLDEALELAPIRAVQVALSPFDERPLRGGIVDRCTELGIAVIAHSPLGGPRRAGRLAGRRPLAEIADAHGATPAEIALAWLLGLSEAVVAIPGARRPETARSAARAARLRLDTDEHAALGRAFGTSRPARAEPANLSDAGEVVLVMGIPGAGKSLIAEEYVGRGYLRLNRDERGGTLRELAQSLDRELSAGVRRVILDNTYLSRDTRSYVLDAASRHRLPARCIWVSTPLAQAQVNVVERLLDRFATLPTPEQLRTLARREQGVMAPTSQMRALRELEPPAADEGFARVDELPFERKRTSGRTRGGVFIAAPALRLPGWERAVRECDPAAPHLIFDWSPDGDPSALAPPAALLAATVSGPVESALCPHAAGPPACWCRPPLPGLVLAFTRAHSLDPSRSALIGTGPAHRTLADTLGARYVGL
jgi:aryl-alcohol dehydrogenase-like predicted oxidoreductase/predicted kinase